MKKLLVLVLAVIMVFFITACSNKAEEATAEPTEEQPQQESEQPNPADVIGTVLANYQKIYEETKEELISNNAKNIGTEADIREASDEGVVFRAGNGENPFMPFAKRLDEVNGTTENQAFYIKFKPSQKDFGFMISADVSAGITIGEENEPVLFVMNHEYMEPLESTLRIEPDNWYHVLLAMDSDGLMQGAIWKDGEESSPAYLNLLIGKSFSDSAYENQSWEISLGFQGEATFTVDSYAYYKFDDFCRPERVLELGNNENIQELQSKDDVLYSMLMRPQELWSEGSGGFAENQGGEFGGGASEKRFNENEGRLEMFSDDIAACVPFNTTLRDCGPDNRPQQAIIVKFQPENVPDFRFSFEAKSEIALSFREDGPYITDVASFFEMPFSEYAANNFEVKKNSIYYILVAIDENAIMRVFVWEEGMIENQAYLEYNLYQGDDDIFDSKWKMFIGFGPNGQFNIYEYWVYTFDNFIDDSPFLISVDNENGDV